MRYRVEQRFVKFLRLTYHVSPFCCFPEKFAFEFSCNLRKTGIPELFFSISKNDWLINGNYTYVTTIALQWIKSEISRGQCIRILPCFYRVLEYPVGNTQLIFR